MAYNRWYTYTYEPILRIADWSELSADVEKKVVAIFSWMPRTIMNISHTDKEHPGRKYKCEVFALQSVLEKLVQVSDDFNAIKKCELMKFDFDLPEHTAELKRLCEALFDIFGSVAASKYLHFSAPKLIPMWDLELRKGKGFKDSPDGFIRYMSWFKDQLEDDDNYRAALQRYPDNVIRGWDIICMERR